MVERAVVERAAAPGTGRDEVRRGWKEGGRNPNSAEKRKRGEREVNKWRRGGRLLVWERHRQVEGFVR